MSRLSRQRFCRRGELKRFDEFGGEQTRFLGEILRPGPIARLAGFPRLGDEALDFFDQVALGRAELFSRRLLQVGLRHVDVVFGFVLKVQLIAG